MQKTSKQKPVSNNDSKETIETKIRGICTFYGLDFYKTKNCGYVIGNGVEYWILKMKKDKVRKLLHQNHGRSGARVPLPCAVEDIDTDRETVRKYFHTQEWRETDLKKTLIYIYRHGNVRKELDKKRIQVIKKMTKE